MKIFNNITTSRRQGQHREGLSGGSLTAKLRVHGQERHIRPGFGGESAQDDEIRGIESQGKWRDCATKVCILIRGDLNHLLRNSVTVDYQTGHWRIKPGLNNPLSVIESESDSKLLPVWSARAGNRMSDGSEVSRGHSSRSAAVMGGAWRRTEHSSRRSLLALQCRQALGGNGRNRP